MIDESKKSVCNICGAPLLFSSEMTLKKCDVCGKEFLTNDFCKNGHYVCDRCCASEAYKFIVEECLKSESKDPIEIADMLMRNKVVEFFGSEHHVIAGAALLTAYKNAGGRVADFKGYLEELIRRTSAVNGNACAFMGVCGAAVSCGTFISIVMQTTPNTVNAWELGNRLTGECMIEVAKRGGPRCCKREVFSSIMKSIDFVEKYLWVEMKKPAKRINCHYFPYNPECLKQRCEYYNGK